MALYFHLRWHHCEESCSSQSEPLHVWILCPDIAEWGTSCNVTTFLPSSSTPAESHYYIHITVENLEQPPRWHTCLLFIGLYLRPVKILNIHRLQRQPIHNKIKKEKSWLWNDSCTSQTQSFISITAVGLHSWNLTLWPFSIFHFIFKYDEKKHYLPLSVLLTAHILVRGGKKNKDRLECHQNVVCS